MNKDIFKKIFSTKTKEGIISFVQKHSIVPYVLIGITMFFLTMMLTAQMKTVNLTTEIVQGKRESQLIDDLANLQRKYNDLKEKHDESTKVVEEYQSNSATNSELISSMQETLKQLSIVSGSENLKGEGIVIVLTDGNTALEPNLRQDSLVHDSDVLTVANELKAAGAEAISINGQRIISTSAIRCVGPVIQINYQKVAAPFTIKAIGNAQYLESALNIKNGVADLLREIGIGVKITREKDLKIPKYDGALNFKDASIDK
ncbi:MAG: DUF881 domain-containing protein [Clostridia bacterium]|nr:DUF881 domain-containing protein [Clostridia bacterium]MDD4387482.1 DUF881 domain-containing protein [Clostridia bacterium]